MAKNAWMHLTQDHLPEMKGLELGKKYKITAEIEPHELSTGENEYSGEMLGMPGTKGAKSQKPPMRGRFKVHAIQISSAGSKAVSSVAGATGKAGKKSGRYS